jgi:hypothetical protein
VVATREEVASLKTVDLGGDAFSSAAVTASVKCGTAGVEGGARGSGGKFLFEADMVEDDVECEGLRASRRAAGMAEIGGGVGRGTGGDDERTAGVNPRTGGDGVCLGGGMRRGGGDGVRVRRVRMLDFSWTRGNGAGEDLPEIWRMRELVA